MKTPKAPQYPRKFVKHGDIRVDNYFWLKDVKHPETLPYLKTENAYFNQQMKPLSKVKNKLFSELKSRLPENDHSVPAISGEYEYFFKLKKGLQYRVHYRRRVGEKKEELLLDENVLARGKKYFDLAEEVISPNHQLLAYATDSNGSERYTLHVRDLSTHKDIKDKIENCGGAVWSADSQYLFYVALDKNLRPFKVYRHELGTPKAKDVLLYEEKDSRFFLNLYLSSSKKYIFMLSSAKESSEVRYLNAFTPTQKFKLFAKRKENVLYDVNHRNQEFWIHTNENADNYQIFRCSEFDVARKTWSSFLKNSPTRYRTDLLLFANHAVIIERFKGSPQISVFDFKTEKFHFIKLPDAVCSVSFGDNDEFDSKFLRLNYSSPVWPPSVLDYDMSARNILIKKESKVRGYKRQNYKCERVWVGSHDGVKVPLILLYKKGIKKRAPVYLDGYGAYGYSIPDSFLRNEFSLVNRGFIFAFAHVRGGGEMGRHWYDGGKFLKKKNTFKDFIACAEYLIKSKRADAKKLFIVGRSAGGMLMGACMNMRPDLFNAVIAHVPFVDVINTMLDDTLLLTKTEYDEWGNPHKKKFYNYIRSYSPYDNVVAKDYPALFVTCGLNDPRVTYWEPAKWVAKLRELKTNNEPILFKTHMGAGHFGNTGRFEMLKETAEEYAFVLSRI